MDVVTGDGWEPIPRPVLPELEDDYDHETFPPAATKFPDWVTQLEAADKDTLMRLAGYASVGEPTP